MDQQDKLFTSVEEECSYWKERCLKLKQERNDAQREFDDFTEESRQLEAELEMTVEQQEKKIRDLNALVAQLRSECESFRRKVVNSENESSKIDADYRQLAKENDRMKAYIRELEQKNDDLERANRVASESVAEFESMLNQAYEKNALLELEVDEKERMQIKLQRLMDEARDLKQELKVRNIAPNPLDGGGVEAEGAAAEATQQITGDNGLTEKITNTMTIAGDGETITTTDITGLKTDSTTNLYLTSSAGTKLEAVNNNNNNNIEGKKTDIALIRSTSKKMLDLESPTSGDSVLKTIDGGGESIDGIGTNNRLLHRNQASSKLILERNGNELNSVALQSVLSAAPMAASDRVSTLSIVADLLRRLDNMEAKLKAWKIRKPSSRINLASAAGTTTATAAAGGGHHHHHHHHHQRHQHNQSHNHLNQHSHQLHSITTAAAAANLNDNTSTDGTVPVGSTVSLNSISGSEGSCNCIIGNNLQLHSYQPGMNTIGTQTTLHQQSSPLHVQQLSPTKVEIHTIK